MKALIHKNVFYTVNIVKHAYKYLTLFSVNVIFNVKKELIF